MNDNNDSKNSRGQQDYDEREADLPPQTHNSAEIRVHVEDFRIRTVTLRDDEVEMQLTMQFGSSEATYYLIASVCYTDDNSAGHYVRIRREGGEMVKELERETLTDFPSDLFDATQAIHETYLQPVQDWYDFSVVAVGVGDQNE